MSKYLLVFNIHSVFYEVQICFEYNIEEEIVIRSVFFKIHSIKQGVSKNAVCTTQILIKMLFYLAPIAKVIDSYGLLNKLKSTTYLIFKSLSILSVNISTSTSLTSISREWSTIMSTLFKGNAKPVTIRLSIKTSCCSTC